ncbi:MAG TPA: aquaporin [Candidatus Elarobacter sp.]|nr:aquaporin [Candidatus Elarobacter sp.]
MPRDQGHAPSHANGTSEGRRIGAEFVGTALLTFVAAGADVVEFVTGGGIGHVARYVAPALVVTAMIWSLSGISGAHINPAVTLAFVARRSFPPGRVAPYLAAQFAGAVVAAFALRGIFGSAVEHGITKPTAFAPWQALVLETILTFILVYTILATSEEKAVVGKNGALAVGGVVALCGLAFSPVSGASMNPARSFGPMLASLQFQYLWIYICGPILGALLAAAVVSATHGPPTEETQSAAGGKEA